MSLSNQACGDGSTQSGPGRPFRSLANHCEYLIARYPEAVRSGPDKVNMADAIAATRKCAEDGVQVLGLDGFVAAPEGFTAPVDLLLDVSGKGLTVEQAAARAEAFVLLKDRPDVLWEVWTEES